MTLIFDGYPIDNGGGTSIDLTYPNGLWSPFYIIDKAKADAWNESGAEYDMDVVNDMIVCNCAEINFSGMVDEYTARGTYNGKDIIIETNTDSETLSIEAKYDSNEFNCYVVLNIIDYVGYENQEALQNAMVMYYSIVFTEGEG